MPVNSTVMDDCTYFFFNDTATTEIYTLSLHDALPIYFLDNPASGRVLEKIGFRATGIVAPRYSAGRGADAACRLRSEEHTSELQSRQYLVCRLLLEKKKNLLFASMSHVHSSLLYLIPN